MSNTFRQKFKIRSEMIRFGIFFGTIAAITFSFRPILGMGNALTLANSVILIYISLSVDLTTKISSNFFMYSGIYLGLGFLAFAADFHIALKGIIFFGVILFMSYILNRGRGAMLYLQLMINFIFMLYNPVSGMGVLVRLIIIESSIVGMMITQWILNRNKFRVNVIHSVRRVSDEIELYADKSAENITASENESIFKETEKRITECSSLFFAKFDQIRQWERGEQYLRLLSVLKGVSRIIYRFNELGQSLSQKDYEKIKHIIKSVDDFNFEKNSFEKLLEDFGELNTVLADDSEEAHFIDEELEVMETDHGESERITRKARSGFSGYRFLYSLKTAIMAAAGVVIIALIGLPYEYWYPINICILSQPFYELSKSKSVERLINTVIATGIVFVAFHVTDMVWVHIIIMAALVFFGDIFFKFNFFTLYAAFMALIMGNTVGQTGLGELTLLRILYVAIASGVVVVVDLIFSRGNLQKRMGSLLDEALRADNALMSLLVSGDFSGKNFRQMFSDKVNVSSKLINMRPFYKDPKLDAFILDAQTGMRMYTAMSDYLGDDGAGSGEVIDLFRQGVSAGTLAGIEEKTTGRNIYLVYVLYDFYETLKESAKLTAQMQAGHTQT